VRSQGGINMELNMNELEIAINEIAGKSWKYCFGPFKDLGWNNKLTYEVELSESYNSTPVVVITIKMERFVIDTLRFNRKKNLKTVEKDIHSWMLLISNVICNMDYAIKKTKINCCGE
jgi:hypothetical protein